MPGPLKNPRLPSTARRAGRLALASLCVLALAGMGLPEPEAAAARAPGGPLPTQVRSVKVQLQGLNADDTVDPGKTLSFQVQVTDEKGRVYSTASDARWPLDWALLNLTTENMQVDQEHGRLLPEADLAKIAGRTYKLTVSYEGLAKLTTTYVLRPQIYAWYRDRMLEPNRLVFPGDDGPLGEPGRHGGHGMDGTGGGRQQKEREAAPGLPGNPGRPGGAGQRGPDIIVAATLARTFDNLVDLVFIEVTAQGKRRYFFRRPTDPPLSVISVGGAGGDGGPGGSGGDGGNGYPGGNGGDGGPGGTGGSGGPGGDGGNIQLFLSRPDLERHFILESRPGVEGHGAPGGAGGLGGRGGIAAARAEGLTGRPGQPGVQGTDGQSGRPGQTSITTGGPAADLNNNPPPEYRAKLFFVNFRVSPEQRVLVGPVTTPRERAGRGSESPSGERTR